MKPEAKLRLAEKKLEIVQKELDRVNGQNQELQMKMVDLQCGAEETLMKEEALVTRIISQIKIYEF